MIDIYNVSYIYFLIVIYSVIGYLCEVVYCFIINNGKFQNRGFLYGPYCPIYGFSSIAILILLDRYKSSHLVIFIMAMLVSTVMEYFTSFMMEKIFNNKWWDYSEEKFNINGRVCLKNSLMFGILGVLLVFYINPNILSLINKIPNSILILISILVFIIMLIDTIISSNVAFKLSEKLRNIHEYVSNYVGDEYLKFKQNESELQYKISKEIKDKITDILNDRKSRSTKKLIIKLPSLENNEINLINIIKSQLNDKKNCDKNKRNVKKSNDL